MQDGTENKARLIGHIGYFTLVYTGLYIALTILTMLTGLNLGRAASIAMLAAAGVSTGTRFAKVEARFFAKGERWLLAFGCLIASYLVSVVGAAVLLLLQGAFDMNQILEAYGAVAPTVWLTLLTVVSLLYYLGLYLCLGMGAKGGLKQAEKHIS